MGENLRLKERDAIRTPMQWTDGANGGFSTSDRAVRPLVDQGSYGLAAVNVEEQLRRPTSLLRWMTRMIRIRKECPEIGAGGWRILPTATRQVLAIAYERGGSKVLCLHNFDEEPREVRLDVKICGADRLRSLLGTGESNAAAGRHQLRLESLGYEWYRAF